MASNPFTELKRKQAGRAETLDGLTQDAIDDLLAIYRGANNSIYAELTRLRQKKFYCKGPQDDFLSWLTGELRDFGERFGSRLRSAFDIAAKTSVRGADAEIRTIAKARKKLKDKLKSGDHLVEAAFADSFAYVAAQTNRMQAQAQQLLREQTALVVRTALIEGVSKAKAAEMLRSQVFAKEPEFKFADRAGRQWDSQVYFEMLAQTSMANLEREAYVNALLEERHDLVSINSIGSKDRCRKWEGRILSLSGKSEGYPSLDSVIATGDIFHPRCRHRLVAHFPRTT